jgi:hypothetical protein
MVSAATNPLTPDDQALLTAYIVYRFNVIELANYTQRPLLDLKDWALQPHIQAEISQYRGLEALQHKTETADARSAGINELMHLLGNSEDPIERRRAAQALIRVGTPQPTRRPKADPQPAPPPDTRFDTDPSQAPSRGPNLDPDADLDPDLDLDLDDLEGRLDEDSIAPSVPSVPAPNQAPKPAVGGTGVPPVHERELATAERSVSAQLAQAPRQAATSRDLPALAHSDTS